LELQQCGTPVGRDHYDIAATTAVTTIGTTEGDVLFMAKRSTTVAACATADLQMCFVNKPHQLT
jgi:hypothetical protein